MTNGDTSGDGVPRLPILDGTKQPQHRPTPAKRSLTVYQERMTQPREMATGAAELRALALESGADDVGLVSVDREDMAAQRTDIEALLPGARTAVAFVVKMNRGNVRAPARSVANKEFHQGIDELDDVSRRIARALEERGHRAVYPPGGFPMERVPGRVHRLGGSGDGQRRERRVQPEGDRIGDGEHLAELVVRGQLQGGLLHVGLPRRR